MRRWCTADNARRQKKVDDCEHFVRPIEAKRVSVFDARIETVAYSAEKRILEIAFKSGQVWQLFDVPPDIHNTVQDSTISSFLNFIAHRYKSTPVKTGMKAVPVAGIGNIAARAEYQCDKSIELEVISRSSSGFCGHARPAMRVSGGSME